MFKKKPKPIVYDKENFKPVIRSSICTGEKVAGFKNVHTGQFIDVMCIRDNKDMDQFLIEYDVTMSEIKTEW